jgi:hypothetical protein
MRMSGAMRYDAIARYLRTKPELVLSNLFQDISPVEERFSNTWRCSAWSEPD